MKHAERKELAQRQRKYAETLRWRLNNLADAFEIMDEATIRNEISKLPSAVVLLGIRVEAQKIADDAEEERAHNEAMEDAFGPHGQG